MICQLWHAGSDCETATAHYIGEEMKRAFQLYGTVYILPTLLFKSHRLLSAPLKVVGETAANITRSSVFLATYCTLARYTVCAMRRVLDVTGIQVCHAETPCFTYAL